MYLCDFHVHYISRPLIPGGPPVTNAVGPVAPPVILSGRPSAGTVIPPAIPPSLPQIPPSQAGASSHIYCYYCSSWLCCVRV